MVKDLPEHYGYETISFECPTCKKNNVFTWCNDKDSFCEVCKTEFELWGVERVQKSLDKLNNAIHGFILDNAQNVTFLEWLDPTIIFTVRRKKKKGKN